MCPYRVNCWKAKTILISIVMLIGSQAIGSTVGITMEGSETRTVSSASNNLSHERPAVVVVFATEEIVPALDESLSVGINSLLQDMTADLDEISTFSFGAITLATTESYSHFGVIPQEVDLEETQEWRVAWGDGAAASAATQAWAITYDLTVAGTVVAAAATAVDTAVVAKLDVAANIIHWSSYAQALATNFSTATAGEDFLAVDAAITLTTLTSAWLMCVNHRYYREYIG